MSNILKVNMFLGLKVHLSYSTFENLNLTEINILKCILLSNIDTCSGWFFFITNKTDPLEASLSFYLPMSHIWLKTKQGMHFFFFLVNITFFFNIQQSAYLDSMSILKTFGIKCLWPIMEVGGEEKKRVLWHNGYVEMWNHIEFEHQLSYYIYFWTNTIGKGMNNIILLDMN